ncbi:MAG: hypothetical protein AAF721_20900 [Myxococcota bacterium]
MTAPTHDALADREELDAALSGDAAALRRLCVALFPTVQHSVAAMLRYRGPGPTRAQERDDLVQEVFRYLLDNDARPLRLWDPERAGGRTLKSWVGLIAGRHAGRLAARRRNREARETGEAEVEESDASLTDTLVQRDLLAKLLDRLERDLTAEELALFEAVFVEVRVASEVAAELGVAPNTIHKRCQRLRTKVASIAAELAQEGQPSVATLALLLLALCP